jgi:hypothetical protein
MSLRMRRAVTPMLAAPVAVVCLATSAAAVVDPDPSYFDYGDAATTTSADCENDVVNAYFDAFITTGSEYSSDANDIKSMVVKMSDTEAADNDYSEPNVHAVDLKYAFGIFDLNDNFSATSGTFKAGSKLKHGEFSATTKAADVEAVKFEGTWRLLHPNRMRTVSCVIKLDGMSPPN